MISLSLLTISLQIAMNGQPEISLFTDTISSSTAAKIQQSSQYLKANFQQMAGEFAKASKTYKKLLNSNAPTYAYEGYLHLLSQTNQFQEVVNLINKTEEPFKDNLDINLINVQALLNTGKDANAYKLLQKLKLKHPENEQIIFYLAAQYEKNGETKKAQEVLQTFLTKRKIKKNFFLLYFLLSKTFAQQKNMPQALTALNRSLKIYPRFEKALLYKGILLEQLQDLSGAITCYQSYLKIMKDNVPVRRQLIQLLFSQQRFAESLTELKKIKGSGVGHLDAGHMFDLAQLNWKLKKHDQALAYVEQILKTHPNFIKAKMLKTEVLLAQNKYQKALNFLGAWLSKTPNDNTLLNTILLLSKTGVPQKLIIQTLEQINKKLSNQTNFIMALADLYNDTKQYDKALQMCTKLLPLIPDKDYKIKINKQIAFLQLAKSNGKIKK